MSQNTEPLKIKNYSIQVEWNNGKIENIGDFDKVTHQVINNFLDDYEYITNDFLNNKHKGQ